MTQAHEPSPAAPRRGFPRPRRAGDAPRLGGMLAIIFWCACGITALPLAGLFALVANAGVSGAMWALAETFAGNTPTAHVLRLGLLPQAILFAWAVSLVVLTVARSRHALVVSPLLLWGFVVVSAFSQFSIRDAIAPEGATLGDFAALMPGLLAQAAGAAALYGYFRSADRPRLYFTR